MLTTKRGNSTYGYLVLAAIVAVGLGVGIVRFINGLGAATNLSDAYPWGLWIVYDVFFIPFSAGAFMISLVTHLYHREEYHAMARPVVLAGFMGYVGVVAILLADLGRWHQFYSVMLPWRWNLHSFMFEVSMCITLYSVILVLEVAPAFLERLNWQIPLQILNNVTVVVASVGIVLSSLHQSSLGSLFLLVPYKLHPLWWTPFLPLLFFTSAAFGGLSMAMFVVIVSYRAFRRRLELGPLANLAKIVSIMLTIYLVLKLGDLILSGEVNLLLSGETLSLLFLAEVIIGVIVPIVLFATRKVRETVPGLVLGSVCVLVGLAFNRVDVAFLALRAPAGATYFPHWMEIVVAVATVTFGVLLFGVAVRFLPVLPSAVRKDQEVSSSRWPRWATVLTAVALPLITIVVVLVLQPVARAALSDAGPASTPPLATYAMSQSKDCRECHYDQQALARTGADDSELARLTVERKPPGVAHSSIGCVTCHWGVGNTEDVEAAHVGVIPDPSRGDFEACLACHHDMPDIFPGDRLQTPHNDVVHGHEVNMHCSDCHSGVAHGIDPMGGDLFCPMDVCLDCHRELGLESEFEDCAVCHTGPHDITTGCNVCHQSTEVWEEVAFADHPVELTDKHATAHCFGCHQQPEFRGLRYVCGDCHERVHDFGDDDCAKCHTPADDWGTCGATGKHPFPLDHGDTDCSCIKCHRGGDTSDYWCGICHDEGDMLQIHEAKDLHFITGLCAVCHPQGKVQ